MKEDQKLATDSALARFSRVTSGGKFIPSIDGLRFIAIATVVLHHLNTQVLRVVVPRAQGLPATDNGGEHQPDALLSSICGRGGVGVMIFFAVSGFILGLPFAKHYLCQSRPVQLKEYFLRRITRLEPPFVIAVIVMFATMLLYRPSGTSMPEFGNLIATLAYLHYPIYGELSPVLGVSWTLEIEVQFYILAPCLSMLFCINRPLYRRGLIILLIIGFAALKATMDPLLDAFHLALTVVGYIHCFLIGFLFADLFALGRMEKCVSDRSGFLADVGSMIGIVALLMPLNVSEPARMALYLIGCPLLLLGSFRGRLLPKLLSNPWVFTIGGMCYTIYLIHYPIIYAWIRLVGIRFTTPSIPWIDANLVIQLASCLPILAIASALYFLAIERPCMRKDWPQRAIVWIGRKLKT
jgi:peptidoglycan/LPS O-acetylase OafA/YrhL